MNNEERVALLREMRASADPKRSEAREKLIVGSMNMVHGAVRRLLRARGGREFSAWKEELVSVGTLSLIDAVDRFDPDDGRCRFSTFAGHYIGRGIGIHIERCRSALYIPYEAISAYRTQRSGRTAKRQSHQVPHVVAALKCPKRLAHGNDSVGITPADRSFTPTLACESDALGRAYEAMQGLPPTWREIIRLRYGLDGGEPMKLVDVGRAVGFGLEWTRRLQLKALDRIRELMGVADAA